VVLIAAVLAGLVIGGWAWQLQTVWDEVICVLRCAQTSGQILEVNSVDPRDVRYRYAVDGQAIEARGRAASTQSSVGSAVTVYYQRGRPTDSFPTAPLDTILRALSSVIFLTIAAPIMVIYLDNWLKQRAEEAAAA
jgi:hypothetical protein